eukprot:5511256-Pyramimonas_sp.AAC.1
MAAPSLFFRLGLGLGLRTTPSRLRTSPFPYRTEGKPQSNFRNECGVARGEREDVSRGRGQHVQAEAFI